MVEPRLEIQAEIQALETVLSALAPLEEQTRQRVLGYVQQRFGTAGPESYPAPPAATQPPAGGGASAPEWLPEVGDVSDIRTLKDKKQPKSAVEMAVLVAYYLAEMAKPPERKTAIGTNDITKFFKQADYRLPSQPRVILHQAKNAGYLDSGGRGQYSLNPVGYNLVTHGLPRSAAAKQPTTRRRATVKSKAKTTKKPTARAKPKAKRRTTRSKPMRTRKRR